MQIIDSAIPLFAERGFDGVSMEALSRAAGVDKVILYRLFGSLGGLYEAAFEVAVERVIALASIDVPAGSTDEQRVRAVLRNLIAGVRLDPGPWLMLSGTPSVPELAAAVAVLRAKLASTLRELVVSLTRQRDRGFDQIELTWFGDLVYGGLTLAIRQHLKDNPPADDDRFIGFLVALFSAFRDTTSHVAAQLR